MARGYFWIGDEQVTGEGGSLPRGQMYVEWEKPDEVRHPHPVVLIHGGGGQGLDYLGTPDGSPDWAQLLVQEGYEVYVVDRPGHGRSPHHPDVLGPMGPPAPSEVLMEIFAPSMHAEAHTQWPGGRGTDSETVRAFMAGSGPMLADMAQMHGLEQVRMVELLEKVGPAVVVCHSAGGPAGYLAADARPGLVKALVAIETLGPPFMSRPGMGSLDWGLAAAPMTYDPPAAEVSDLALEVHQTEGPIPMTLQADPPRRLASLAQVPIAVVTSPCSPFALFDGHLTAFLEQAGCTVDLIRLAERGLEGNGHGMMLERNNAEVLQLILDWVREQGA